MILGVTLLTFFLLDFLPGNTARQLLGSEATTDQVSALEQRLGLDQPAGRRYWQWLNAMGTGDLGQSLASRQRVAELLLERTPVTLQLVLMSVAIALTLSMVCAVVATRYLDRTLDRAVMALSMAILSAPGYVLALLLVLAFSVSLRWLPAIGYTAPNESIFRNLRGFMLPSLAVALPLAGLYTRVLRADLAQSIRQSEYITAAVAKGAGPWRVIIHHALPNSMTGIVTLLSMNLGVLLSGTVVIEQIFALPGLGQLLLQSVTIRDTPVVQGIVLLLGVSIVGTTFAGDVVCRLVDPRIEHGSRHGR